jgi:hypothetical protein
LAVFAVVVLFSIAGFTQTDPRGRSHTLSVSDHQKT